MHWCNNTVVQWCSLYSLKSSGPSETVEFKNKDKSCATGAVVCYINIFALCLLKCRKVVQMCIIYMVRFCDCYCAEIPQVQVIVNYQNVLLKKL